MKTGFIDKRKKLLEIFLLKVSSCPFLCNSAGFQSFIHNEQNFAKTEKEIKIPTLPEIATTYQELFAEFTYFQPSLQHKAELREFLIEFQEINQIMRKVKKVARSSSLAFARFEESIAGLMNGLKTVTPLVLQNRNLNIIPKENYVNPYLNIREWLRADLLDIESIIEGINACLALEDNIKGIEAKIEKKKKTLEGVQSGKKSISQRIFNKPQESIVSVEEKGIEELESSKDALGKILDICIGKMLQSDIPKFKQQKVYKICVSMRNYSLTTVQEYQEIAEQILQIEESLGI